MDIIIPIIIVLVFIVLIFCGYYFNKTAIIKRQLKTVPLKNLGDVKNGETAKIVGVAQPVEELLIAPLSERPCCHYHILVEQKVQRGKHLKWETIIEDEASIKYVIEKNGRYAYIESQQVRSLLVKDRNYQLDFNSHPSPKLEAFLRKHGYERENWSGFNVRYHEGIIENGETIAVLGKGEWKDAEAVNLPAHYGRILCITADEKTKFVLLSDDKEVVA